MTRFKPMTPSDRMRLKADRASHKLFKAIVTEPTADGLARSVSELSPTEWKHLRTLVQLDAVDIREGRVIVKYTVSSLCDMGYI